MPASHHHSIGGHTTHTMLHTLALILAASSTWHW